MAKKRCVLFFLCCSLLFSCSDNGLDSLGMSESTDGQGKAYLTVTLTMKQDNGMRSSTDNQGGTAEGTEGASDEECRITDACILLGEIAEGMDAPIKVHSHHYIHHFQQIGNNPSLWRATVQCDPGRYRVMVIANPGDIVSKIAVMGMKDWSALVRYVLNPGNYRKLQTMWQDNNFLMTNAYHGSLDAHDVVLESGKHTDKEICVQRACARFDYQANKEDNIYSWELPVDGRKSQIHVQLGEVALMNIQNEYARKAGYKALLFEQEHLNCGVTVQGDADKLEQILDNLLTNAVKFTLAGSVGFYSSYTDGKLCVEICDTGIGMNEDTLERIFRPFERAAQEINSEGFGLGLFITKNLVEVLEGSISVESHPGKGSVFYVALPLAETSEDCEPEEIHLSSPVILPKRILVVDDDTIQLKIAEDMLTRNGVECTTCRDAKEVITALRYSDYDLVLTDIQMPVTDGFGLLKLLRGSDIGKSKTVPVAVMTARGDGDSGVYIKAGFCGCIHKPFVMKGLMAFISSMMTESSSYPLLFDYSRLIETIGDRQHMFRLVIQESEKDFAELERALKKTNREAMRKTVHRMMPVWELLGADKILSAYQKILHIQETSDDAVREHTLKIMEYIQALIGEANNELEKKDNETEHTCSGG